MVLHKLPGSPRRRMSAGLFRLALALWLVALPAALPLTAEVSQKIRRLERGAILNLQRLFNAANHYKALYGGYPPSFAALGPPQAGAPPTQFAAGLISAELADGIASGYLYTLTVGALDQSGNITNFQFNADPITIGTTGIRQFFMDDTGVIRFSLSGRATVNDPPI